MRRITGFFGFALACLLTLPQAASAEAGNGYRAALERAFQSWLQQRWPQAEAAGISHAAFEADIKGLKIDWSLPQLALPDPAYPGGPRLPAALKKPPTRQAEFDSPGRYFSASSLNVLAAQGRAKLAQLRPVLAKIQQRYHVSPGIVLAIWGRETNFGRASLPNDALSTIATQGFLGRHPDKFAKEFVDALVILQKRHVPRSELRSSWAGAMGHVQFLPSDYLKYAVDFDGNGEADIWTSTPDALASAANALHQKGWNGVEEWGYEVTLPKGFDCTLQGPNKIRSFADWTRLGVARVRGRPFSPSLLKEQGFLVLPAGMEGPAFLVTRNFGVLKRYNNSDVYALFVGHLADMIVYGAPANFVGAWLPVDRFSRSRMLAAQKVLVSQGYDVGKVDGLVGFKTRQAIGLYQRKIGAPETCYPSKAIVDRVLSGH